MHDVYCTVRQEKTDNHFDIRLYLRDFVLYPIEPFLVRIVPFLYLRFYLGNVSFDCFQPLDYSPLCHGYFLIGTFRTKCMYAKYPISAMMIRCNVPLLIFYRLLC